jgi:hypothetical protein
MKAYNPNDPLYSQPKHGPKGLVSSPKLNLA